MAFLLVTFCPNTHPSSLLPVGAESVFQWQAWCHDDFKWFGPKTTPTPWTISMKTEHSNLSESHFPCGCDLQMSGWNLTRAAFWNGTSREQQTDCRTAFPEKEKPPIDQQELWSHTCKQGFQRKWNESWENEHGKFLYRKIQTHRIPVKRKPFLKSKYVHKYWLIWFS